MIEQEKILVTDHDEGLRLDVFLAQKLGEYFSRSQIKKHIDAGVIRVQGKTTTAHYKVKSGDEIQIDRIVEDAGGTRAQDIPLDILFEDEHLILVNKPAGMVVHPAHGNPDRTLVNALLYHFQQLSTLGGVIRPGIIHRLDKDTSGVMVIAKSDRVHAHLANQFKNHTIEKIYYVFVRGVVQHDEGICEEPIGRAFLNRKKVIVKPSGGKEALSYFKVHKRFAKATWVEVYPQTGRTHQIRVHMAHLGHPVLGDSLYGIPFPHIHRQALHAYSLAFQHPVTQKRLSFVAPIPEDIQELISYLEKA